MGGVVSALRDRSDAACWLRGRGEKWEKTQEERVIVAERRWMEESEWLERAAVNTSFSSMSHETDGRNKECYVSFVARDGWRRLGLHTLQGGGLKMFMASRRRVTQRLAWLNARL
eukprot:767974-Hanusia_phi.AAC.4